MSKRKILARFFKRRDSLEQILKEEEERHTEEDLAETNTSTLQLQYDEELEMEETLFDAAMYGDYRQIAKLLSLGVSTEVENFTQRFPDAFEYSVTPLHTAAANGFAKCVETLINYRANVEAKNKFDCTALHLAAANGHYLCVKILLEAGAHTCASIEIPFCPLGTSYIRGTTALHLAAKYNHAKCIKELMRFGADCHAVDMNGHTSLYIAAKAGFSECVLTLLRNARDEDLVCLSLPSYDSCNIPLYYAVENRMVECVKELTRLGSDVNHINSIGFSPLHLLCYNAKSENNVDMEVLKYLVLEGFNTNVNKTTASGLTALFCAAYSSNASMASFLITYGADVNVKDNTGLSLLEYELSCKESFDILKSIVKCMPQLPHLNSLNVSFPTIFVLDGEDSVKNAVWQGLKLPDDMKFSLVRTEEQVYVRMFNNKICSLPCDSSNKLYYVDYPLQQPLLNLVYNHVIDGLKCFKKKTKKNLWNSFSHFSGFELLMLKKQLWYERMASTPPSLMHFCRYSIRKGMHPFNLKHIRKLSLPEKLLSYLLFESDD